MPQLFDNLEIPQPPYRMARPVQRVRSAPVATLAMAGDSEKPPRDETSEEQLQRQFKGAVERLEAPSSPEAVDASVDDAAIDAIKKAPMKSDAILQEKQKYLDAVSGKTPQSASGRLGEKGLGLRITPEIQEAARIAEEKRAAEKSPVVPSVNENKVGEAQVEVPQSDLVPPEKPAEIVVLPNGRRVEVLERDDAGDILKSKTLEPEATPGYQESTTSPFIKITPEEREMLRVASEKGLADERNRNNFDIEFPQPPAEGSTTPETTPVIPELDSLTKIQGYIEDSRRQGRSPEFIKGLEMMRKDYIEKARRPVSNSGRVNIQPGTPEGEALAAARKAAEEALDNRDTQRAEGEGMTGVPAPENQAERKVQEERARKEDIAYKSAVTRAQSKAIKENEERGTDAPEGTTPEVSPDESLDILREAGEGKGPVPPPEGEKRPQENVLDVLREGQGETSPKEFGSERISTPATPEIEEARADAELEKKAQDRIAQLEEENRKLRAQLSGPQRAEAGGDGGGGDGGGGGGEQPAFAEGDGERGGTPPTERATRISEIGEQEGLSFWENWATAQSAGNEDFIAGISAAVAKKWAKRLDRRDGKIKKWEDSGREKAKKGGMFAMLKSMAWDEQWANYHRWKGRTAYRKQEAWNDSRIRRENSRNDILNEGAAKIDRLLDSQKERIDQYALQSKELDERIEDFHTRHKFYTDTVLAQARPEQLQAVRDSIDELAEQIKEESEKKRELNAQWQLERKRAAKQQARKEALLSYAGRPARVDTTPKDYKWLVQRIKPQSGTPKAREGSKKMEGLAS